MGAYVRTSYWYSNTFAVIWEIVLIIHFSFFSSVWNWLLGYLFVGPFHGRKRHWYLCFLYLRHLYSGQNQKEFLWKYRFGLVAHIIQGLDNWSYFSLLGKAAEWIDPPSKSIVCLPTLSWVYLFLWEDTAIYLVTWVRSISSIRVIRRQQWKPNHQL